MCRYFPLRHGCVLRCPSKPASAPGPGPRRRRPRRTGDVHPGPLLLASPALITGPPPRTRALPCWPRPSASRPRPSRPGPAHAEEAPRIRLFGLGCHGSAPPASPSLFRSQSCVAGRAGGLGLFEPFRHGGALLPLLGAARRGGAPVASLGPSLSTSPRLSLLPAALAAPRIRRK